MTQNDGQWPPHVVAAHQPVWIRIRDFVLTTAMWLLLLALLNNEFELFLGVYLDQVGFGTLLARLGLADPDAKLGWMEFIEHLGPYLIVTLVLLLLLSMFAAYTVLRRRRALGEASPRPLSMARQARYAALTPMAVLDGVEPMPQRAGLGEMPIVDGRGLLAMLNGQDKDTLAEARTLRIAMVNVTADGLYRIERVPEVFGQTLAGLS
jgi:hypothetical protein